MSTSDGTVIKAVKIVDHGSPEQRFNIVLVAEGYQKSELPRFAKDAQHFTKHLFGTSPFDDLQCAINVYRIDVASKESGADDPKTTECTAGTGKTAATYFDATFCTGGIRRLMSVNQTAVLKVVKAYVPQWHLILVIVNSSIWGGAGGSIAITTTASGWEDISIHEMGHSAFGLADEYDYWAGCGTDTNNDKYSGGEPSAPNVTTKTDRSTLKWKDLVLQTTSLPTTTNKDCSQCDTQPSPVPVGTVGAFEGAAYYHCAIYRPQYTCKMRSTDKPFCAVCQRRIRQTLSPYLADCYAPVFEKKIGLLCALQMIIYILITIALLPFALFPPVRCIIKKLLFRIQHCPTGNSDPCIEL
ncbi:MAG: hypothetical protein D6770_11130 [Anaerolineae bacterium]|nr:MAG: hypothetical protein D6770_11130 [Anaerolineae bacterium]